MPSLGEVSTAGLSPDIVFHTFRLHPQTCNPEKKYDYWVTRLCSRVISWTLNGELYENQAEGKIKNADVVLRRHGSVAVKF